MISTTDMTAQQADALANYLHHKRPGERSWTKAACTDALREAWKISRDCRRIEAAAINAANDPSVRTPAVIGMPGRHWEPQTDAEIRREGVKAIGPCGDGCHGAHMPDAPHVPPPMTFERVCAALESARTALRQPWKACDD